MIRVPHDVFCHIMGFVRYERVMLNRPADKRQTPSAKCVPVHFDRPAVPNKIYYGRSWRMSYEFIDLWRRSYSHRMPTSEWQWRIKSFRVDTLQNCLRGEAWYRDEELLRRKIEFRRQGLELCDAGSGPLWIQCEAMDPVI